MGMIVLGFFTALMASVMTALLILGIRESRLNKKGR